MTTQVYWGVSVPMVCQLCRRPVQRWEGDVVMLGCEVKAVVFAAACHGRTEVQLFPVDGRWLVDLHPAVAFPMPSCPDDTERAEALAELRLWSLTPRMGWSELPRKRQT